MGASSLRALHHAAPPVNGTIPIVIGGHTPAAARRAGRRGDGFFPGSGTIEELTELFAICAPRPRRPARSGRHRAVDGGDGPTGAQARRAHRAARRPRGDPRRRRGTRPDELAEFGADLAARYGWRRPSGRRCVGSGGRRARRRSAWWRSPGSSPRSSRAAGRRALRRAGGHGHPAVAAEAVRGRHRAGRRQGVVGRLGQLDGDRRLLARPEEDEDLLAHLGDDVALPGHVREGAGETEGERFEVIHQGWHRVHARTALAPSHPRSPVSYLASSRSSRQRRRTRR